MRRHSSDPVPNFPIIPVAISRGEIENRGARRKFWLPLEDDGTQWLLKFPRPDTGEHWAEKVAAEVGRLFGINTARVDLARADGELATICRSFYTENEAPPQVADSFAGRLHGSEFFNIVVPGYDRDVVWSNRAHNVKTIIGAIASVGTTAGIPNWMELLENLSSFALLDALVGNMDRHHDNWMLLYNVHGGNLQLKVAPSFDHASSLGRELTDERRQRILHSSNGILNYLKRGRGGVFTSPAQRRAPSPLRLAQFLCRWNSELADDWSSRLVSVPDAEIRSTIDRIPPEFMSPLARELAYELIITSRAELMRSIR